MYLIPILVKILGTFWGYNTHGLTTGGESTRKNSQGQKQRDKNETAMVKDQKVAQWLEE